jgi:hypothetical protein
MSSKYRMLLLYPVYDVAQEPAFLISVIMFQLVYVVALGTTFIVSVLVF